MKSSLLLSFALMTALLAAVASTGSFTSRPQKPVEPEEIDDYYERRLKLLNEFKDSTYYSYNENEPDWNVRFDTFKSTYCPSSADKIRHLTKLSSESFEAAISGSTEFPLTPEEITTAKECREREKRNKAFAQLTHLSDEDFELAVSGSTEFLWTPQEISTAKISREVAKKDETKRKFKEACSDANDQVKAFITEQIANGDVDMLTEGFKSAIWGKEAKDAFAVKGILGQGKNKFSEKELTDLVAYAFMYGDEYAVNGVIECSALDVDTLLVLAIKNLKENKKSMVDKLLGKKGTDFTGGEALIAAATNDKIMVRLLNEDGVDSKFRNYEALKTVVRKDRRDKYIRYFLKASKVDISDVEDKSDLTQKELGLLRTLDSRGPPWQYNYLQDDDDEEVDDHRGYTGDDKWRMQYYPGPAEV